MLPYRSNLEPPIRAADVAAAQGRKGKSPIVLDERQLRQWARLRPLGMTEQDAATLLGCTAAAYRRELRRNPDKLAIWEKGPVETKVAVLGRQMAVSQMNRPDHIVQATGQVIPGGPHPLSAQMAMWLGKNHFGQSDRTTNEITGKDGGPIEISDAHADIIAQLDRIADRLTGDAARVIDQGGTRLAIAGKGAG